MTRSPKHPARQRHIGLRWAAAAALLFFAVLVNEVVGKSGYLARREQRTKIEVLTEQIDRLKQENQQLAHRIEGLRSDPAAIEEIAREQLHLGRPGEVVVALPSQPTTALATR